MRFQFGSLTTVLTLAVTLTLTPCAAQLPKGLDELKKGHWKEAEIALKAAAGADQPAAALGLAELYLTIGRPDDAEKQLPPALSNSATRARALTLQGEIAVDLGKPAEGIRAFQAAVAADAANYRARLLLGRTYDLMGQNTQAQRTLDWFYVEYNAGRVDKKRSTSMAAIGMAARSLQSWQDANKMFQDAAALDPTAIEVQLEWADLFLEKYRADEAAKGYVDALKLNTHLPRALVGLAEAKWEGEGDEDTANKLADEALKENPRCLAALCLKARILLDEEEYVPAEALLKKSLEMNGAHVPSLSLLAASRFLQEDTDGYDEYRRRAVLANPRCAEFHGAVGDLAVRHHRYPEGVDQYRKGLVLDATDPVCLTGLGVNLLRMGPASEPEALQVLTRAFKKDPFNVRTYNTLNLYEEVIAKEYESVDSGPFRLRLPKKERPLLERFVPGVLQTAWDAYVKKYGFTPQAPIMIELFTQRQHYGARTTGLPEIGAQGTCFGSLITAMSPSSAEADWELVLSHELAHVFQLQLSKNRVPRWFAEGLAEYETNIARPYWRREHTRELFFNLKRGDFWKLGILSSKFTRPDRADGVTLAYHQSSLVIHYLAETFGFPKLVDALKLYGAGKRDAEVLMTISGKSLEALDSGFVRWFSERYAVYSKGFWLDPRQFADLKAREEAAQKAPENVDAQAALAAAQLEKDPKAAAAAAAVALKLNAGHPLARFVLAEARLQQDDMPGARQEFEALLAAGTDGFPIRFALARIALRQGSEPDAVKHLTAARLLDPESSEPLGLLMAWYEKQQNREAWLQAALQYVQINEHDHETTRLLLDRLALDSRWPDVEKVAPRAIALTPMEAFVHQAYARSLVAARRHVEAAREFETAVLAGARRPGQLRALAARAWLTAGDRVKARASAEQALKDDPENPEAKAVLSELK